MSFTNISSTSEDLLKKIQSNLDYLFDDENNHYDTISNIKEIHDYVSLLHNYDSINNIKDNKEWKYKHHDIDLKDLENQLPHNDVKYILNEYKKSYSRYSTLPEKLNRVNNKMSLWNAFVYVPTTEPTVATTTTDVTEPTVATTTTDVTEPTVATTTTDVTLPTEQVEHIKVKQDTELELKTTGQDIDITETDDDEDFDLPQTDKFSKEKEELNIFIEGLQKQIADLPKEDIDSRNYLTENLKTYQDKIGRLLSSKEENFEKEYKFFIQSKKKDMKEKMQFFIQYVKKK
jgi:hypothetical protein